jgi:hypothetical protein
MKNMRRKLRSEMRKKELTMLAEEDEARRKPHNSKNPKNFRRRYGFV